MRTGWLLSIACAWACAQDHKIHRSSNREVFWQEPTDEVDVLWVIDNSQSMANEQAKLAERFDRFLDGVDEAGMDWHIGVISTDLDDLDQAALLLGEPMVLTQDTPDYAAKFRERVQVGIEGSDMEKGIDAAFRALSVPISTGPNDGFRREGATLMINYLSDENDCSDRGEMWGVTAEEPCYERSDLLVPMVDLIRDYKTLRGPRERLLVGSIVGPDIAEGCEGAKPGTRYGTMAEAFDGLEGNICDQDFGVMMDDLGLQLSSLITVFVLEDYAVEATIEVWVASPGSVDEERIGADSGHNWTYDSSDHTVTFHDNAVPSYGSRITIEYTVSAPG